MIEIEIEKKMFMEVATGSILGGVVGFRVSPSSHDFLGFVKELYSRCFIGETQLFIIYIHYGNLIQVP